MNPLFDKTIKFLKAVRRLLNRETGRARKGWTQGVFARAASRTPVDSGSPKATCFCLMGAINATNKKMGTDQVAQQARIQITKALPPDWTAMGIVPFNDAKGRTQKEVVDVVTRAIKTLEKGAS